MISVCPAILTGDLEEFKNQLDIYSKSFKRIDIDINLKGDDFLGKETISIDQIKDLIVSIKNVHFGIHLMVNNPVEAMTSTNPEVIGENLYRVFVHQGAIDSEEIKSLGKYPLGIVINPNDKLLDFKYYNQFDEIQLMSVQPGYQGSTFEPSVLDKVLELRDMGYKKEISIDGGVDLETSGLIKEFPINRVSVGSYFSKHLSEIPIRKMKLELSLNMKSGTKEDLI